MTTLYTYIKYKFLKIVSLIDGTDVEGTIETVQKGIQLRGATVWILLCGAMLASIGLDQNSSAVIIGAMLISPLMSPIIGIGLAVGIVDRDMLILSLKNFALAVGIVLVASAIYFRITLLGMPTPEMFARTRPTILDVGVAVFGGVAGIIANSRREKTNAIPGVAIATALMPPLCTSGYGIARGNWEFFLGAFYLFFINAVFISLSTYVVVRLLKFPTRQYIEREVKRKIQRWILAFVLIIVIPSGIIFYNVVLEARMKQKVQSYTEKYFRNDSFEAIERKIVDEDTAKYLKLYVIGEPLSQGMQDTLAEKMDEFGLDDIKLKVVQMNVNQIEKSELMTDVTVDVMKKLEIGRSMQEEKDMEIDSLRNVIHSMRLSTIFSKDLKAEINALFPEVQDSRFGMMDFSNDSTSSELPFVILKFNKSVYRKERNEIRSKYMEYLKLRMKTDTAIVIIQ